MSVARHHAEWLSLVESSGPFLSMPVLLRVFPQGLEQRDGAKAGELREAYEDWLGARRETNCDSPRLDSSRPHQVAGIPARVLVEGQAIPPGIEAVMANYGETLRPDSSETSRRGTQARPFDQALRARSRLGEASRWARRGISPDTRMMELLHTAMCHSASSPNGEQWMIVSAPRGETTGFASWYADLWMQEPNHASRFPQPASSPPFSRCRRTRDARRTLRREQQRPAGGHRPTRLPGPPRRRDARASVRRIDAESSGKLLAGVKEKDLYDSALTVMMRLVFLFSAEERGLLLLGDPLYDQNYAVSTFERTASRTRDQHGEGSSRTPS